MPLIDRKTELNMSYILVLVTLVVHGVLVGRQQPEKV